MQSPIDIPTGARIQQDAYHGERTCGIGMDQVQLGGAGPTREGVLRRAVQMELQEPRDMPVDLDLARARWVGTQGVAVGADPGLRRSVTEAEVVGVDPGVGRDVDRGLLSQGPASGSRRPCRVAAARP